MKVSKSLKPLFSIFYLVMVFSMFGQNNQATSPPSEPITVNDKVHNTVEEMPRFPGCENMDASKEEMRDCASKKLLEFVYSNLYYPKDAKINKIEGTAIVQFVVDESGQITNAKVVRDINGNFEGAILDVLKIMPNWIPGKQKGKAVKVSYTMPVKFKLPRENTILTNEFSDLGNSENQVVEEVNREYAADFEMILEDGSTKKLSDFKGKVVYLSFWASWCGPCIKGFDKYKKLRKKIENLGVVMLNVSIDKDSEKWRAAIAKYQPNGIHAIVPHAAVRELYQMNNIPRYEIIGKDGKFLYLSDGASRNVLGNFKKFIDQ